MSDNGKIAFMLVLAVVVAVGTVSLPRIAAWFIGWLASDVEKVVDQHRANDAAAQQAQFEREMRQCPFCAEAIKRAAVVCRYCQRDVPNAGSAFAAAVDRP